MSLRARKSTLVGKAGGKFLHSSIVSPLKPLLLDPRNNPRRPPAATALARLENLRTTPPLPWIDGNRLTAPAISGSTDLQRMRSQLLPCHWALRLIPNSFLSSIPRFVVIRARGSTFPFHARLTAIDTCTPVIELGKRFLERRPAPPSRTTSFPHRCAPPARCVARNAMHHCRDLARHLAGERGVGQGTRTPESHFHAPPFIRLRERPSSTRR